MIISRAGNGPSLYPLYWLDRFAVYRNAGGLIVARIADGFSLYVQPGDDANALESELDTAAAIELPESTWIERPDLSEDESAELLEAARMAAMQAVLEALEGDSDLWRSPSEAGGAPSSDGGFWGFYAGAAA